VKTCKVPAYTRKMKELIGKITETSSALVERRQAAALNLQDMNAVVRSLTCHVAIQRDAMQCRVTTAAAPAAATSIVARSPTSHVTKDSILQLSSVVKRLL